MKDDRDWSTEKVKWFFDQTPPRQVDETLLNDALNIFFPKILRVILYLLPMLISVTVGLAVAILVKTTDIRGDWRLLTEAVALTSGKVHDVEMRKSSRGSITHLYRFEFTPVGRGVNDPQYRAEYEALEDEFSLTSALINVRTDAGFTQEELARRMNTTQSVIARMESGRVKPSSRTLERFAKATGMKMKITFVPDN